mmetsp:Transcript_28577/g.42238  ORF Transcript_28577/g.42238 Transcript_28577/m.42238 type:complete len:713 (-) Transcript_28577:202-2340(-)
MMLSSRLRQAVYSLQLLLLLLCPIHGFHSSSTITNSRSSSRMILFQSTTTTTTPVPKYPTNRGETVDSRDIVASQRPPLLAIRLLHILFATETMASQSMYDLRLSSDFSDLASQVSMCTLTRDEGGSIGWVNVAEIEAHQDNNNTKAATVNDHLNDILPMETRKQVLRMNTKPGDVVMVESSRGFHLVQVADVMVDVRKMAQTKRRRRSLQGDGEVSMLQQLWNKGRQQQDDNDTTTTKATTDLTYVMETMGCQMNQADSERMEGQLQSLGIVPLLEEEENDDDDTTKSKKKKKKKRKKEPNVVILNTCSIRDHAEQKVYSHLGPHAKRKRNGEDVTIVVAGCVAQQEGQQLLQKFPEIDLVMGPQYANRLSDLLEDVVIGGNQVLATDVTHIMEDVTKPRRTSTTCAWVNVIYGCNDRCTYCIVPTTRGVEQSRPVESIVEEVKELIQDGYKEVTLLGQNIDAYGRDMVPKRKFSDLIRTIGSLDGLKRLRFVTSHPRYMSMGVIDAVAETPTACHAFHIPFQSGSNAILQEMGRGHDRDKYLQIVNRIRDTIPEASITADVIVGFPGETEEDFQDTLDLMNTVVFDSVNTAAYSPRPHTPAASYADQVEAPVKKERLARINALNLKHASERRARLLGTTVEVLVEERNMKSRNADEESVMGRTTQGYLVYCPGDIDELRGSLIDVKITNCETYHLSGVRVDDDDDVEEDS